MHLLLGHDVVVAQWVGERVGAPQTPPYTAIGFLGPQGVLAAGFVFYSLVPNVPAGNIEMAVAARGRLTRGVIAAVGHYVFEQVGASRITCRPPADHARAISILKRIGFTQETVCRDWYGPGRHATQLRILKHEAKRWLP